MLELDINGFRKIAKRWIASRGYGAVVGELASNSLDEKISRLSIELTRKRNKDAVLQVTDDSPNGFSDIRDAFTLFATSKKVSDPTMRGRFNAGEKYVIALAKEATIVTTTGGYRFDGQKRTTLRQKTEKGSVFTGTFSMTDEEFSSIEAYVKMMLVPKGIEVLFNGEPVMPRKSLRVFKETLETEKADKHGVLQRTRRKAELEIYEVLDGETAMVYEMGMPVVETGDRWHVNVMQRVPLNMERDNIPPRILKAIRTFVANHMAEELTSNDANSAWLNEALGDKRITAGATSKILDVKFGENRVIRSQNDPESAAKAFSKGFGIIGSRSLTKDQRENVKRHGAAQTSAAVFPTTTIKTSEHERIPLDKQTPRMRWLAEYCKALASKLLDREITVEFYKDLGDALAAYGNGSLSWKATTVRRGLAALEEIVIHEFGHDFADSHLSPGYHDGLCDIAVKFKDLALDDPDFFKTFYKKMP